MVYLKRFLFALSCLGFLILPVSAMQPAPSSSPPQGAGNFDRVGVVCLAAPFEVTNDTQLDAFLCDVIAGELEARLDGRFPVDILGVADPEVHAAGRLVVMGQLTREVVDSPSGDEQVMYAIMLSTYRYGVAPDRPQQPFPRIVVENADDDYDTLRKKMDAAVSSILDEINL